MVVVGVPVVDMVAYVTEFPSPGGHSPGTSLTVMPGGPAVNVASGVARLGCPVTLVGRIGDDHLGTLLRRGVEADGVRVPRELVSEHPTATVLVLFDSGGPGQMRSFSFRHDTADTHLAGGDLRADYLTGAGAMFLDGILALEEALTVAGEAAVRLARQANVRVFLDPNLRVPGGVLPPELGDRMIRLVRLADELLLNEFEARLILRHLGADVGVGDVLSQGGALAREFTGLSRVVIKRGAEGAVAFEAGRSLEQRAFAVEVSDTSGAGDSFDAAWLCAHVGGHPTSEALRLASAAAALTVTGKGAWASLPTAAARDGFLLARANED